MNDAQNSNSNVVFSILPVIEICTVQAVCVRVRVHVRRSRHLLSSRNRMHCKLRRSDSPQKLRRSSPKPSSVGRCSICSMTRPAISRGCRCARAQPFANCSFLVRQHSSRQHPLFGSSPARTGTDRAVPREAGGSAGAIRTGARAARGGARGARTRRTGTSYRTNSSTRLPEACTPRTLSQYNVHLAVLVVYFALYCSVFSVLYEYKCSYSYDSENGNHNSSVFL